MCRRHSDHAWGAWRAAISIFMSERHFGLRISLFYLTSFLVLGIFVPFFPLWLKTRGLSSQEIAITMAAPMAARLVIVPIMTLAADRMGDRRLIAVVCSLAALAAVAAMPAASGFIPLMVLTILHTGSMTPLMPIVESIAMDGAQRLSIPYGRMRLWGSLAFIGGSMGAGALLDWITPARVIWLVLGSGALTVLSAFVLPGPVREGNLRRPSASALARAGMAMSASPQFLLFAAASGTAMSSHAVLYTFGSLHWQALGFGGSTIGALWATGVLAEVALLAFGTALLRTIPAPRLLVLGAAGGCLRWAITGMDPPIAVLLPLQALHALSFAATHLGAMKFLQAAVPKSAANFGQGLYVAIVSGLFMGLALLLAGPLYAALAGRAYLAMALLCAVGILLAFKLEQRWNGGLLIKMEGEERI
jgi:PPP family 3-phenylpropionic acid transporter